MATKKISQRSKPVPTAKQDVLVCTPEQEHTALQFVNRIIKLQKIAGHFGDSDDNILSVIEAQYTETVEKFLDVQRRLVYYNAEEYQGPGSTLILREKNCPTFVLTAKDVDKNGELSDQTGKSDYLFAISDRRALAYEVKKAGKSKYVMTAYFCLAYDNGAVSWFKQLIDIDAGAWSIAFRCPCCGDSVKELIVSNSAWFFGCPTCHTALDSEEAAAYQKAVKHIQKAGGAAVAGGAR